MKKILKLLLILLLVSCKTNSNEQISQKDLVDAELIDVQDEIENITRHQIEEILPSQINSIQNKIIIVENEEINFENLIEFNSCDNGNYYFVFKEDNKEFIAIPDTNDDIFQIYDYSENKIFSEKYNYLIWVTPGEKFQNQYNLKIYNLNTNEIVEDRNLDSIVHDAISNTDLHYNFKEIILDYKDIDGGIFYVYQKQAGYTFSDSFYSIDWGGFFSSSSDGFEREPITRELIESYEIIQNKITFNGYVINTEGENIISCSRNINNFYSLIEQDNYGELLIKNYDNLGRLISENKFDEAFIYQDEILEINPINARINDIVFIIETSEFNYDFYLNPDTQEYFTQLRYKDFNRFNH